jgi:hypothetical protein
MELNPLNSDAHHACDEDKSRNSSKSRIKLGVPGRASAPGKKELADAEQSGEWLNELANSVGDVGLRAADEFGDTSSGESESESEDVSCPPMSLAPTPSAPWMSASAPSAPPLLDGMWRSREVVWRCLALFVGLVRWSWCEF